MFTSIYFQVCSLFFILLLLIIYFSKKRLKSLENNIFIATMVANTVAVIFDISSVLAIKYLGLDNLITTFTTKGYLVCITMWLLTLTVYIYAISRKNSIEKNKTEIANIKKIIWGVLIVLFISTIIIFNLPLYYNNEIYKIYSFGPAAITVYVITAISIVIWIFLIIVNFKHIKKRKCIPIIFYVILGGTSAAIQFVRPEILLVSFVETFVTFLMFFTIENPDLQLIRELYKNRQLIDKSNEDTSKFIFRMTQDLKIHIKQIQEESQRILNNKNLEEIHREALNINNAVNQMEYLFNNALNISYMTTKKIKIYENKYNANNLFKEMSYRASKNIPEKVIFTSQISDNIPPFLYGDSIKLKQALSSTIQNALDHTKKGFIDFSVSSVVKYNACRLIIQIEDSGEGMDIEEVNKILSLTSEEMNAIDINKLEEKNISLQAIKKIITLLGGSMMVKSEKGSGTSITIVLDQKIVEHEEAELSKRLETYEQSLQSQTQALIVDDDEKITRKLEEILGKEDINTNIALTGQDAIEKILAKKKYDFILINDELTDTSALMVLKELRENKKFNIPIIIMIDNKKEFIKLHYVRDGFADTIIKSDLDSEMKRIIKRFQ